VDGSPGIGFDAVEGMSSALSRLHEHAAALIGMNGFEPQPESPAARELGSSDYPARLRDVYHQTNLLMDAAGDYLRGVARLTAPGRDMTRFAASVCARALLEAAAVVAWIADPGPSAMARIGRGLALRYEGVDQQRRWAAAEAEGLRREGDVAGAARLDATAVAYAERLAHLAQAAAAMGFAPIVGKSGAPAGAGTRKPGYTDLVGGLIGAEADYRLLCGLVHAQPLALRQIGFEIADPRFPTGAAAQPYELVLAPHAHPEWVAYVCSTSGSAFIKCLVATATLFGWSMDAFWADAAGDVEALGLHQADFA